MPAELIPVITFILGWIGSVLSDVWKDHRTLDREVKIRQLTIETERNQQRNAFQRETLLELQETLFKLVRATGAILMEDKRALREIGTWGRNVISVFDTLNGPRFEGIR